MRGLTLVAGLALLLAIACTSVHNLEYERAEEWIPQAQRELQNTDVLLVTVQGASYEGDVIAVTRDSVMLRLTSDATLWGEQSRDLSWEL